jgi:hypothetical protein
MSIRGSRVLVPVGLATVFLAVACPAGARTLKPAASGLAVSALTPYNKGGIVTRSANVLPGAAATVEVGPTLPLVASPTITGFSPTSGSVGKRVTIKGTNLADATEVTFNGVEGTITHDAAKRLEVKVPTGATTGKIKVTTRGGNAETATAFTVIAEWSTTKLKLPTGAVDASLLAVSCLDSSTCFAVGDYQNSSQTYFPLIVQWNGSQWSVGETFPADAGSYFKGVDCSSGASMCIAVGATEGPLPLVELWNYQRSNSWTAGTDVGMSDIYWNAVSCVGANCYLVGGYEGGGPESNPAIFDFLLSQDVTSPANSLNYPGPMPELEAISCFGATIECLAVGSYTAPSGAPAGLAVELGGSGQGVVDPSDSGTVSFFDGVSCTSSSQCFATGANPADDPGVFSWNGTGWVNGYITGGGGSDAFTGVSCSAASSCVAVGAASSGPMIIVWDGATWAPDNFGVSSGTNHQLNGVDCLGVSRCVAVGETVSAPSHLLILTQGFSG